MDLSDGLGQVVAARVSKIHLLICVFGPTPRCRIIGTRLFDIRNKARETALFVAVTHGALHAADDLIAQNCDHGTPMEEGNGSLAHMAIKAGQFDVASALLQPCAKRHLNKTVDLEGCTVVHLAAGASRFCGPLLKQLLDKGGSAKKRSKSGATPMHMAAEKGHIKVIDMLVQRGASVNAKDFHSNSPLHRACATRCNSLMCKHLTLLGADIDGQNDKVGHTMHLHTHMSMHTIPKIMRSNRIMK